MYLLGKDLELCQAKMCFPSQQACANETYKVETLTANQIVQMLVLTSVILRVLVMLTKLC